jgi:O-antigen/teichoic acid export membrane protein
MIFASLNSLVNTANNGLGFILGRNLERPIESLRRIFDVYSTLYTFVVFVIMTTASVLSIPFVTLYTSGIEDVNYVVASVPVLFGLISVMSGARAISARLISVSGHARRTLNRSLIEMFINIISSVILVNFFDIYGVLLGTVIALIYRMNDIIIYANRKILKRSPKKTYTILIAYLAIYFAAVFLSGKIGWNIDSYAVFALYGVICVAVFAAVYFIPTLIVEREGLISLFRYLRRKK